RLPSFVFSSRTGFPGGGVYAVDTAVHCGAANANGKPLLGIEDFGFDSLAGDHNELPQLLETLLLVQIVLIAVLNACASQVGTKLRNKIVVAQFRRDAQRSD